LSLPKDEEGKDQKPGNEDKSPEMTENLTTNPGYKNA
jgi:hypothetical protein